MQINLNGPNWLVSATLVALTIWFYMYRPDVPIFILGSCTALSFASRTKVKRE